MKENNIQIVNRGIGGCCDKYNVDSIEVNGVVIAVRFTRWDDESRKYYEIPASVKNQAAVIAAFPELDITEDEPGAILLRNADDKTAVKVGMFADELDGELTPEPTNTDNNNNPENNTPTTMNENETTELGYNAATRSAMIDAARAFLVLADELNEQVSAYIDGSDKPEADAAYNAVKDAEAVFLRCYCAYWDEPRRRPCLGYELAESSLPEDDEYFNGAA